MKKLVIEMLFITIGALGTGKGMIVGMGVTCLMEKFYIDPELEINCGIFSIIEDSIGPHRPDFFELFLVIQGTANHFLNGEKWALVPGSIVLVRPNEVHYFEKDESGDCRFMNVVISVKLIYSLLEYLRTTVFSDKLFNNNFQCVATLFVNRKGVAAGKA